MAWPIPRVLACRLPTPPAALAPLNGGALNATLAAVERLGAPVAMLAAVGGSLPRVGAASGGDSGDALAGWSCEAEGAAARALLEWFSAQSPAELQPGSMGDDEAALRALEGAGRAHGAEHAAAQYRLGRRQLWSTGRRVLRAHLEAHSDCDAVREDGAPSDASSDVPGMGLLDGVSSLVRRLLTFTDALTVTDAPAEFKVAFALVVTVVMLYYGSALIPNDLEEYAEQRERGRPRQSQYRSAKAGKGR
eukprot:4439769-Prymnesium_polylepis.1